MPDTLTPDSTGPDPVAPYTPTERTLPTRSRGRASYDRDLVHSILDAAYLCHLGFVRDGAPVVLPTLFGRVGERLYVHGSTGSRPLRAADASDPGLPVCLTVTHVDALVLARSAFHHSVNYRSVVVHGVAVTVTDPEERRLALDAIVEQGRPGQVLRRAARRRQGTGRDGGDPARSGRGLGEDPHRRSQRRTGRCRAAPLGGRRPAHPRVRRTGPGGRPRPGRRGTGLPVRTLTGRTDTPDAPRGAPAPRPRERRATATCAPPAAPPRPRRHAGPLPRPPAPRVASEPRTAR
ncbi:nitroimidazol reductase NimA-like FMN-containing flavoprotein (pyridoxamine 5'-phosphate oxidase superfamily) [Streptomyces sp. TE33382]